MKSLLIILLPATIVTAIVMLLYSHYKKNQQQLIKNLGEPLHEEICFTTLGLFKKQKLQTKIKIYNKLILFNANGKNKMVKYYYVSSIKIVNKGNTKAIELYFSTNQGNESYFIYSQNNKKLADLIQYQKDHLYD